MNQFSIENRNEKFIIMEQITIQVAKETDASEIYNFKVLHFDTSEPVRCAHVGGKGGSRSVEFLIESIRSGLVLMAIESSTKTLVGISICNVVKAEDETMASETGDPIQNDLLRFFDYVDEKANIFETFNVDEHFHIMMISVHSSFRGRGIATNIFQACLNFAKSKNSQLVTVNCSSSYTAKIAEKLEMRLISTVTYDEVNELLGRKVFVGMGVDKDVKTFAKIA
jgi:arylalkylamine N-acetyltransferase